MAQQQHTYTPSHIAPILCECGGIAHLMRRTPDNAKGNSYSELRTFECEKCKKTVEVSTD